MRSIVLLAPVLALALSGCVSTSPAQRRAFDEAACRDYGFRPGTNAFAECLQRIDLSRRADRRAALYGDGYIGGGYIGAGIYGGGRW